MKAQLAICAAIVCAVCVVDECSASTLDDVRTELMEHIKSGAAPSQTHWSRYVATYKDVHAPKQTVKSEIPKFKWAQTKTKLTITVAIPGVKDEKVDFGDNNITVTGTSARNDRPYELKLTLFKPIRKGSFTKDNKAVYLTMKKRKKESYWNRLTQTKPVGVLKRAMEVDWAKWVDESDLGDEDDDVDEDDVQVLEETNFDSWVTSHEVALVEFYAPWCGHCKELKPQYAKAATELAERNSPAKLAKVDGTQNQGLAQRFGVSGYPTLKVFRGDLKARDYKGERTSDKMVEYMEEQLRPSVQAIEDVNAVRAYIRETDNIPGVSAFIGFFEDLSSEKATRFNEVAEDLRDEISFGVVKGNASLFKVEGTDQIVLFKPFEQKATPYSGQLTDSAAVGQWLLLNVLPTVGMPSLEEKYAKRKLPMVWFFKDPSSKSKRIVSVTKKISKTLYGKYSVMLASALEEKERMQSLGITPKQIPDPEASQPPEWNEEEDGPWEAPIIDAAQVAIDEDGGKVHYAMPQDSNGITFDGVSQFVSDHQDCSGGSSTCKLTKSVKSEPAPEKNDGPVIVAVGDTFDEIVMDDTKDVLVEFYAPWCGHCKQLAPVYEQLGTKVAKSPNLVIAKLDASANDVPNSQFDVSGFPSLYFKPAGQAPKSYEGGRTVKEFVDYLKKEATHAVVDT